MFRFFWGGSNLVGQVGPDFCNVFPFVKLDPPIYKIVFHQILESVVLGRIDVRVANTNNAALNERLNYSV